MGSLFSTPKAPRPMDVAQTGQQQQNENTRSAFQQGAFNRINQSGPFGSVSYSQSGTDAQGNPIFSQQTSLNPEEMAYRGQQRDAAFGAYQGGIQGYNDVNLERVGSDPNGFMAMGAQRFSQFGAPADMSSNSAFDRAYGAATSFSAPRQQREQTALETQLANQGFERGTEGYNNALRDLTERQSAANNTLTAQIQGQIFNQGLQGRQQDYNEAAGLYGIGQNEAQRQFGQNQAIANVDLQKAGGLGGLGRSGMVEAATAPGVSNYNTVNTGGPVDYAGLTSQNYTQQNNVYNQQMQQRNAMLGGLAGIAGTVGGAYFGMPARLPATVQRTSDGVVNGYPNNDPHGSYPAG
jgi:hypothetical protein